MEDVDDSGSGSANEMAGIQENRTRYFSARKRDCILSHKEARRAGFIWYRTPYYVIRVVSNDCSPHSFRYTFHFRLTLDIFTRGVHEARDDLSCDS